jgi:hypothetical protein
MQFNTYIFGSLPLLLGNIGCGSNGLTTQNLGKGLGIPSNDNDRKFFVAATILKVGNGESEKDVL